MNHFKRFFSGFDPYLMGAVAVLLGFGGIALVSSSVSRGAHDIWTQSVAMAIGIFLLATLSLAHPKTVHRLRHPIVLAAVFMLAAVLVFGQTVKGTRGWFYFGPLSLQPIEFVKVALIIVLASILPLHARMRSFRAVIGASVVTVVFVILTLLQPDFGSAMILIGLWGAMLLVSGVPRKYVLVLFVAAVAVGALSWQFAFHDYQKERVLIFLDPSRDPLGRGYNVTQAQIAVGSGGFLGSGFASGSQSQLRFLPESRTDFVFSLIAEELGFVAAAVLVMAIIVVVWRLYLLARRAPDDFSQFVAVGAAALISIESFIAIGGNIGLVPMTGITLPFVSSGGSSMMAHLALIGLVQGVSRAASRSVGSFERPA
jgi:rod shape determining protein RodA